MFMQAPEDIAYKASTIISMVPTATNVREVYLGKSGVLRALENLSKDDVRRTICIDESTIQQEESRSIANQVKQTGAEMIDAPVSGGREPLSMGLSILLMTVRRCRCKRRNTHHNGWREPRCI